MFQFLTWKQDATRTTRMAADRINVIAVQIGHRRYKTIIAPFRAIHLRTVDDPCPKRMRFFYVIRRLREHSQLETRAFRRHISVSQTGQLRMSRFIDFFFEKFCFVCVCEGIFWRCAFEIYAHYALIGISRSFSREFVAYDVRNCTYAVDIFSVSHILYRWFFFFGS